MALYKQKNLAINHSKKRLIDSWLNDTAVYEKSELYAMALLTTFCRFQIACWSTCSKIIEITRLFMNTPLRN